MMSPHYSAKERKDLDFQTDPILVGQINFFKLDLRHYRIGSLAYGLDECSDSVWRPIKASCNRASCWQHLVDASCGLLGQCVRTVCRQHH